MTRRRPALVGADGTPRGGLRRVYVAEVASGLGDGVFWIALVTALAGEPRFDVVLTGAVIVTLGPRAMLSYPVGRLLDRAPVRRVLVGSNLVRGILMFVATAVVTAGVGVLPLLGVVLLAYVAGVPVRPALSAALPRIAGEVRLATAAATLSGIRQLMTFIGPLVGVAVVTLSVPAGFVVKAVAYLVVAGLLASISGVRWPDGADEWQRPAADGDVRGALRHVPGLRGLVTLVGGMYLLRGAEVVLFVLVVTELLGAPVESIGFVNGGVGLGALIAAPLVARHVDRRPPERGLAAAVVLTVVSTALLTLVGTVLGASATVVFVGVAMVVFELVSVVTVQRAAPDNELGTVFGALGAVSNGAKLGGALLVPVLVAAVGVEGAILAVAGMLLVVGVATLPAVRLVGRVADARRGDLRPTVDALARISLFADAPRHALERLASELDPLVLARGAVVVAERDAADDLYVVRDGDVEVVVGERQVNIIGTGGWFGEVGLIEQTPRNATVRTLATTQLWRVPGELFLDVLEQAEAPPAALLEGLRLRSTTDPTEEEDTS